LNHLQENKETNQQLAFLPTKTVLVGSQTNSRFASLVKLILEQDLQN